VEFWTLVKAPLRRIIVILLQWHSKQDNENLSQEMFLMKIGSSIALIAIGAILAFAVPSTLLPAVDLTMIGYILLALGVIGFIATMVIAAPRKQARVSETRSVVDPNTGETVVRRESQDTGGLKPTL
jgi:hypothetical protein